jgi:hypothetical protein
MAWYVAGTVTGSCSCACACAGEADCRYQLYKHATILPVLPELSGMLPHFPAAASLLACHDDDVESVTLRPPSRTAPLPAWHCSHLRTNHMGSIITPTSPAVPIPVVPGQWLLAAAFEGSTQHVHGLQSAMPPDDNK